MCAYHDTSACQQASGLSAVDISHQMFAITRRASSSLLSIACQSLGNYIDFEHQSRTPYDVLTEYKEKLMSFRGFATFCDLFKGAGPAGPWPGYRVILR